MSDVFGGLRDRLIGESMFIMLHDGLDELGHFAVGDRLPVVFRSEPFETGEAIPLNTLLLLAETADGELAELGSNTSTNDQHFFIEFYADSEAFGKHVIGDVRALLEGRIPDVGRTAPILAVYDWRQATPPLLFWCELEDIAVRRSRIFDQPWEAHWFSCRCSAVEDRP